MHTIKDIAIAITDLAFGGSPPCDNATLTEAVSDALLTHSVTLPIERDDARFDEIQRFVWVAVTGTEWPW
jgi:hypothetical protein